MGLPRTVSPRGYWLTTIALIVAGAVMAAWYAPVDPVLGLMQKIAYVHIPAAALTFVACALVFIASVGFLATRAAWWDDLADASARVTVLFCSVVLVTGMMWAREAWGHWWVWSPKLTFSLALWVLFVAYLGIRPWVAEGSRRTACAVYGVIAFLDVPLLYLSIKLMPDRHPTRIDLTAPMQQTLFFWFLPMALLGAGLIATCYRRSRRHARGVVLPPASARADAPAGTPDPVPTGSRRARHAA